MCGPTSTGNAPISTAITGVNHWPTNLKVSATGNAWQFYKIALENPTGETFHKINVVTNSHGRSGCNGVNGNSCAHKYWLGVNYSRLSQGG